MAGPIFSDHNHLLRWRPFCRSSSNEWRCRLHLMGSCFLLLLFTPLESNQLTHVLIPGGGGGWGGGPSHMKGAGCSSSRRGVNFGLWCHLGCSRQNAIIFCRKGLFQGCKPRNIKKYIFSIRFIYSIYVIKVFFRGQKRLGHPQIGLL